MSWKETNGKTHRGDYLKIKGDGNKVIGDYNKVRGKKNTIDGDYNVIAGNDNKIFGDYNTVSGERNSIKGDFNKYSGKLKSKSGYKNTSLNLESESDEEEEEKRNEGTIIGIDTGKFNFGSIGGGTSIIRGANMNGINIFGGSIIMTMLLENLKICCNGRHNMMVINGKRFDISTNEEGDLKIITHDSQTYIANPITKILEREGDKLVVLNIYVSRVGSNGTVFYKCLENQTFLMKVNKNNTHHVEIENYTKFPKIICEKKNKRKIESDSGNPKMRKTNS